MPRAGLFFVVFCHQKEEPFMKTKPNSPARNIVLAALFLALAFDLPMNTGHEHPIGTMLFPCLLNTTPSPRDS